MYVIFKELQRCRDNGLKGVLGTIISTEGSTYQKTGAKCFITEDGILTGLLSGGCVEGDLKEYVQEILATGLSRIVHYDFQDDGDIVWGLGLGCNGKMNVYLEPYLPGDRNRNAAIIDTFFSAAQSKPIHRITIVATKDESLLGTTWLVEPSSRETPNIPFQEILQDYNRKNDLQKNGLSSIGGQSDLLVFYEFTEPPPELIIFGAGPDAIPLVQIAKMLNWHTTVLDYRTAFVTQENFPNADQLIVYPAGTVPDIAIHHNSYVILMTHNFIQDQIILENVLKMSPSYLGVLGPRKRTDQLIGTSEVLCANPMLHHIHSPIGLDLGSKTPEEIALSIVAEIMLAYRGGTGSRLSEGEGKPTIRIEKEREVVLKP
ncbi:XdhC/CoxI family protein [Bacillus sp. CECT 9360]|uniref:XdhC family protein n=1 Tax=Bacillus sp. CECT 9360 TaxID=2845821 RepID=UPI001E583AAF|nr:XdhC/CoxI family protein [Bacillus sp. CECT 9360]CAH0343910.1 putative xanthine dehydrogenase subunit A [Bacillus sp. CECT 9360]